MKYTIAVALSLITTATYTVSHDALKQALFDLDLATVEQFTRETVVTQEEKSRYIALAEEIKKPYQSGQAFKLNHRDIFRMGCGAGLCGISFLLTTNAMVDGSLVCLPFAAIFAYLGLKNIARGYSSYSAKEDMRKIILIADTLKRAVTP